jgi:hypothetical protein
MTTEIEVAIIGLSGVGVGSTFTLILTYINRRFDDRRQLRELAIKVAFDHWQSDYEHAKTLREITHTTVKVAPLDTYIVHMLMLAELISNKSITNENVATELKRIRQVSDKAYESAKQ